MGGIASGKSTACKILEDLGAHVISCDTVAREIREKEDVQFLIKRDFGNAVVTDGRVDRDKLRNVIFRDESSKRRLEDILLNRISKYVVMEIHKYRPNQLCVVEGHFFEPNSPLYLWCDYVWTIYCDEKEQLARLMSRNGFSEQEAQKMIYSQPDKQRMAGLSDAAIRNSTPDEMAWEIKRLWALTDWNL